MKYSKEKAKERKQKLVEIKTSLKEAEEALTIDPYTSNFQMEYDSHFDYKAKGAIIRSRANWYESEKSNKYFLGLELNRGTKSCIRKMFTSDGSLTRNPKKITMEIEKFYSGLYTGNDEAVDESHPFLLRLEIPKLTPEMKSICEGKLSAKECLDCLQSFEIISPLGMMA